MNLLVMPSSRNLIDKLSCGIVIGIKGLSVNMPIYFDFDEAIDIINSLDGRDVFVCLNKNMHNIDIPFLKEVLFKLDEIGVSGVLFYDVAVVNIKNENNLSVDLVWAQEHMTTNYVTSNFWFNNGVKYSLLSSEITIDEVKEFRVGAHSKLILPIFGYLSMFVSRRHLVKNYLEHFNLSDNSLVNYIEKEGKVYPIIDDENGTIAYSSRVLNGLREVLNLEEIDYLLLNSFNIDEDIFVSIVDMFNTVNSNNVDGYCDRIDEMLDTDCGFLYKETIYRVKNNG